MFSNAIIPKIYDAISSLSLASISRAITKSTGSKVSIEMYNYNNIVYGLIHNNDQIKIKLHKEILYFQYATTKNDTIYAKVYKQTYIWVSKKQSYHSQNDFHLHMNVFLISLIQTCMVLLQVFLSCSVLTFSIKVNKIELSSGGVLLLPKFNAL